MEAQSQRRQRRQRELMQLKAIYKSLIGQTIYNYYLRGLLGVGGFGGVFLAEERVRQVVLREVAVKLILDDESNNQLNELRQATHLEHPHLVRAHAAGACELNGMDFLYLVMEKGEYSLQDKIERQLLSIAETKTLVRHVAAGLKYLHQQGKVHRDLKPGNVLWANSSWKLSDFGLVRSLGLESYVQTASSAGTKVYMPPEAFDSKISPAWDIWSLGIIIVVALTGKLPYQFEDDNQLMKQVMAGNLQLPSLPEELQALVQSCLHRNHRERWTAQQVLDYLDCEGLTFDTLKREVRQELWTVQQIPGYLVDGGGLTFESFKFETAKLKIVKSRLVIHLEDRQNHQWVEQLPNGVTLEMVKIPGGTFLMGAAQGEEKANPWEYPQRSVTIPGFLMGKYLVTRAQWRAVAQLPQINRSLDLEPSECMVQVPKVQVPQIDSSFNFFDVSGFNKELLPVKRVSWSDCIEFCARLSQATGLNYRLPSEAEWEYACRAETTTPFYFGDTLSTDLANYQGDSIYGWGPKGVNRKTTTPVGSFPANGFGLYDMHGNLWEWCLDDWHNSYQGAPRYGQPWFNKNHDSPFRTDWQGWLSAILQHQYEKLLRGGSWFNKPELCRSALRYKPYPAFPNDFVGFRVCCSVERTS